LSSYIDYKLQNGKVAIGFDDLNFNPEKPNTNKIVNLDVIRSIEI